MQLDARMRTHIGVGVNHNTAAHTAIMAAALRLARRLTNPPAAQFCSMGPNNWCFQSQACMRGELRMAAQPAIRIKTVVGRPGIKTPAMPMAKEITASARNNQRAYQLRTKLGAGTARWVSGGLWRDMASLCLQRYAGCVWCAQLLLKEELIGLAHGGFQVGFVRMWQFAKRGMLSI